MVALLRTVITKIHCYSCAEKSIKLIIYNLNGKVKEVHIICVTWHALYVLQSLLTIFTSSIFSKLRTYKFTLTRVAPSKKKFIQKQVWVSHSFEDIFVNNCMTIGQLLCITWERWIKRIWHNQFYVSKIRQCIKL